jgi:hypothetical protein
LPQSFSAVIKTSWDADLRRYTQILNGALSVFLLFEKHFQFFLYSHFWKPATENPTFKNPSTTTLTPAKFIVSSKTGIQRKTGFRVKPGMTNPRGFGLNILNFKSSKSTSHKNDDLAKLHREDGFVKSSGCKARKN